MAKKLNFTTGSLFLWPYKPTFLGAGKDGGWGYVKTDDDDNDEEGDDLEIKPLDVTSEQVEEKADKVEDAVTSNEKEIQHDEPAGNDEVKKAASTEEKQKDEADKIPQVESVLDNGNENDGKEGSKNE